MSSRSEYISFCENHELPLMMTSAWLEVVTPDAWSAALSQNEKESWAVLPFVERKRWGMTKLTTPFFTASSGPFFTPFLKETVHGQAAEYHQRLTQLLDKLPSGAWLDIKVDPAFQDVQPWLWSGFQAEPMYTHFLQLKEGFEENYSRTVRKALNRESKGELIRVDWDEAQPFCLAHHQHWNTEISDTLERLVASKLEVDMWAWKVQDQLESLVFVVRDKENLFLLTSAVRRDAVDKMSFYLLLTSLFEEIKDRVDCIDFMGSSDPQLVHTFRSLGATPMLYFRMIKNKKKWLNWRR